MPILTVATNVLRSAIPADFAKKLCAAVAQGTGKHSSKCLVFVNGDQQGTFGGTDNACAFVEIQSIDGFGEKKRELLKLVSGIVIQELHVQPEHFYVKFVDITADQICYQGILKSDAATS